MRKSALVVPLAALLLLVAACANPLRQYGQEAPPSVAASASTFDDVFTRKLEDAKPFPQVKSDALKGGNINLSAPLHKYDPVWRSYLIGLNDGRDAVYPRPMEAIELVGITPDKVCDWPKDTRYPEPKYPLYCQDKDVTTPQSAVVVVPDGFTAKLQQFGTDNGEREGWVLASIIAGLAYAKHLRYEMQTRAGVQWPMISETFDYCVAGISLRAIFPASMKELSETDLSAVLTALDTLQSAPNQPDERSAQIAVGFTSGKLDQCVG